MIRSQKIILVAVATLAFAACKKDVDPIFIVPTSAGAEIKLNCDKLLTEFKEVNLFIRKVYQKQYIVSAEGKPAWNGVDSLE